jgi:hypothetical protein
LPDIPVAITSCLGRSVISAPSRSTTTIHSRQSPILSFGENTGQFSGNLM